MCAPRSLRGAHDDDAARGPDELERAVAPYPVVRAIEVRDRLPARARIHVVEHRPAPRSCAALPWPATARSCAASRSRAASDDRDPRHLGRDRLTDPAALHGARIAGAAPAALRPRLEAIEHARRGRASSSSCATGPS